jgi:hypothetical protein
MPPLNSTAVHREIQDLIKHLNIFSIYFFRNGDIMDLDFVIEKNELTSLDFKDDFKNQQNLDMEFLKCDRVKELGAKIYINELKQEELMNCSNLSTLSLNQTKFDPKIFTTLNQSFNKLVELSLNHCNLQSIPAKMFIWFPNLIKLNLSSNLLKRFELETFSAMKKIKVLNVSSNNLAEFNVKQLFAENTLLEELILDRNSFEKKIQIGSIKSLKSLKLIDIYKAEKSWGFGIDYFVDLSSLTRLEIGSDNSRQSSHRLESNVFESMYNLKHLTLSGFIEEEEINPSWFKNLKKLESLDLLSNCFNELKANSFSSLTNLKKLLIKDVDIQIDKDAFVGLENLQILTLAAHVNHMFAGTFDPMSKSLISLVINTDIFCQDLFRRLNNLRDLYIDSGIQDLTVSMFKDLKALNILMVVGEPISTIEPNTFKNLINLKKLTLCVECFQEIHPDSTLKQIFAGLENLEYLNLNCKISRWQLEELKTFFKNLKSKI